MGTVPQASGACRFVRVNSLRGCLQAEHAERLRKEREAAAKRSADELKKQLRAMDADLYQQLKEVSSSMLHRFALKWCCWFCCY